MISRRVGKIVCDAYIAAIKDDDSTDWAELTAFKAGLPIAIAEYIRDVLIPSNERDMMTEVWLQAHANNLDPKGP